MTKQPEARKCRNAMSHATSDKPAGQYRRATIPSRFYSQQWIQTTDCPEGRLIEPVPFQPSEVDVLAIVGEWAMVRDTSPKKTMPAFGHWGTHAATLMPIPFVLEVSRLIFDDQDAAPNQDATSAA